MHQRREKILSLNKKRNELRSPHPQAARRNFLKRVA
jgi:hypothetical protein